MSRDHRKLSVFQEADRLVVPTYQATQEFPSEERFGLQSQVRRAALSVATNLVEGCARHSESEFRQFVSVAVGSAAEVAYLLEVSARLGFLASDHPLLLDWANLVPALKNLHTALYSSSASHAKPRTQD